MGENMSGKSGGAGISNKCGAGGWLPAHVLGLGLGCRPAQLAALLLTGAAVMIGQCNSAKTNMNYCLRLIVGRLSSHYVLLQSHLWQPRQYASASRRSPALP